MSKTVKITKKELTSIIEESVKREKEIKLLEERKIEIEKQLDNAGEYGYGVRTSKNSNKAAMNYKDTESQGRMPQNYGSYDKKVKNKKKLDEYENNVLDSGHFGGQIYDDFGGIPGKVVIALSSVGKDSERLEKIVASKILKVLRNIAGDVELKNSKGEYLSQKKDNGNGILRLGHNGDYFPNGSW